MDRDRQRRVRELFEGAMQLPPPARGRFLAERCGEDAALAAAVGRLLKAAGASGDFLEGTASEQANHKQLIQRRIGKYRILRELGSGGMGVVYLVRRDDGAFEHLAALKVIRPMFREGPLLERFRREREILARLDHPNIARILDGGTTEDGLPWFLMDYVQGEPIDAFCRRRQSTLTQRLNLFRQVCAPVAYLHQHNVLHRDLKPANILVTDGGLVKLLDFGIAKVLQPEGREVTTGISLMTPGFASPEQLAGEPLGPASDLYSLGLVLFTLLTGTLPYDEAPVSLEERLRRWREEPAPSPAAVLRAREAMGETHAVRSRDITRDLEHIVLMALRTEPDRRYATAAAMADDIEHFQGQQPVRARGNSPAYVMGRFSRRHRGQIAASLLVAASLGCGGAASVMAWRARVALQTLQNRIELSTRQVKSATGAVPGSSAQPVDGAQRAPVPEGTGEALHQYSNDVEQVAAPLLVEPFAPRAQLSSYLTRGLAFLSLAAPQVQHSAAGIAELERSYLATARLQWSPDRPSLNNRDAAGATCRTALDLLQQPEWRVALRGSQPQSEAARSAAQSLYAFCGTAGHAVP